MRKATWSGFSEQADIGVSHARASDAASPSRRRFRPGALIPCPLEAEGVAGARLAPSGQSAFWGAHQAPAAAIFDPLPHRTRGQAAPLCGTRPSSCDRAAVPRPVAGEGARCRGSTHPCIAPFDVRRRLSPAGGIRAPRRPVASRAAMAPPAPLRQWSPPVGAPRMSRTERHYPSASGDGDNFPETFLTPADDPGLTPPAWRRSPWCRGC
jgi:hypothetical protein